MSNRLMSRASFSGIALAGLLSVAGCGLSSGLKCTEMNGAPEVEQAEELIRSYITDLDGEQYADAFFSSMGLDDAKMCDGIAVLTYAPLPRIVGSNQVFRVNLEKEVVTHDPSLD